MANIACGFLVSTGSSTPAGAKRELGQQRGKTDNGKRQTNYGWNHTVN
jgi:hypothetical protein